MEAIIASILVVFGVASHSGYSINSEPQLTLEEARKIALVALPGRILEEELETERNSHVYEFEIETHKGLFEIEIDAISGAILEIEPEDD